MLTDENIYQNKMRYLQLLTKLGVDLTKLTDYLDSPRADFFMKPYSTYPDGAYAGALCEHNLKLYDELVNMVGASGAISVLLGFLAYYDRASGKGLLIALVLMSFAPLLMGVQIAWYAHLFGFGVGFSLAFLRKRYGVF